MRKFSYTVSIDQSGILHPHEPDSVRVLNTLAVTVSYVQNFFANIRFSLRGIMAVIFFGDAAQLLWDSVTKIRHIIEPHCLING
jgi:hypothetical protein